ncbi:hypothetical protein [Reyranella sp.]|uniref:hypothetical protein n=1 Tax=Reyranella sp. TaxID=1929291 RepID=UPI003BAB555D
MEWSVSTRIAILLARMPQVVAWEADGFMVDAEYCQDGREGAMKGEMKLDLIVHKRCEAGSANNLLACEIKLHDVGRPRCPPLADREKLARCKGERFEYQLAIWLAVPRKVRADRQVWYSEFDGNGLYGRPVQIPALP